MFYLPCSYITTFLMEIPNNINTSRLCDMFGWIKGWEGCQTMRVGFTLD